MRGGPVMGPVREERWQYTPEDVSGLRGLRTYGELRWRSEGRCSVKMKAALNDAVSSAAGGEGGVEGVEGELRSRCCGAKWIKLLREEGMTRSVGQL